MGVFITKWYLYKTHFKTISENSEEQHPQTTRRHYGQKKITTEQTLKWTDDDFEKELLDAIDEGFSWLGESGKQTIYFHLETEYKISKQDIPHRIEDFTEALEDVFGLGAKLLEIKIMENLFNKIRHLQPHFHTQESLEFTKYIESARTHGIHPCTIVTCLQQ